MRVPAQHPEHAGPSARRPIDRGHPSRYARAAYAVAGIAVAVGMLGILSLPALAMSGCWERTTECESNVLLDAAFVAAVLALVAPVAGGIVSALCGRERGLIVGAGSAAAMVVLVYAIFAVSWS